MSLINNDKPIVSLANIADLLNTKQRTLKIYEDKGLLPKRDGKLYTLNDIKKIAFVHYLAGVNRINANGIRFINSLMNEHIVSEEVEKILAKAEEEFKNKPMQDITEIDNF